MYPAFGPGAEFSLDWMLLILVRNLVATWAICGFWDWFLYFSPLQVGKEMVVVLVQVVLVHLDLTDVSDLSSSGQASQVQDEPCLPVLQPDEA